MFQPVPSHPCCVLAPAATSRPVPDANETVIALPIRLIKCVRRDWQRPTWNECCHRDVRPTQTVEVEEYRLCILNLRYGCRHDSGFRYVTPGVYDEVFNGPSGRYGME